jgi:RNA polymerase sigma-70 factor (ECF subfamily)
VPLIDLLPHLDSAYNLARWLLRNAEDAEDVVQEAYLRAFKYSRGFHGGDARAWLLAIVRNTAYNWLRKRRTRELSDPFDERIHADAEGEDDPERLLLRKAERELVAQALGELPVHLREILVLREWEDLSYREISEVMGMPIGTVMSSLSRARGRLRRALEDPHTRISTQSSSVGWPAHGRLPTHRGEDRSGRAGAHLAENPRDAPRGPRRMGGGEIE